MARYDTQGREYLWYLDLKFLNQIEIDDGFTCHKAGMVAVWNNHNRPYFLCDDGQHFIDGQDDGDGYCVGCYRS